MTAQTAKRGSKAIARGSATRTANKNKRRAQILSCAGDIIANEGIESLTLGKLAARAEVTVPTIHNLIGKKDQIYKLLVNDMVVSVEDALTARATSDPIKSAEIFIDSLIDLYRSNEAFYKAALIASERIKLDDKVVPTGVFARSLSVARRVCRDAVEAGNFAGKVDTEQMARQVFGCQRLAYLDWIGGYIDLDAYRTQVLTGMFLCFTADASPALRKRLLLKIRKLK